MFNMQIHIYKHEINGYINMYLYVFNLIVLAYSIYPAGNMGSSAFKSTILVTLSKSVYASVCLSI